MYEALDVTSGLSVHTSRLYNSRSNFNKICCWCFR